MVYLQSILLVVLGLFLSGCKPSSPEKSAGGGVDVPQHGFMLTQSGFNSLSPDDQFVVANKALSTMYRGLPMDEFFDLTQGLDAPQVQYSDFISVTQGKLLSVLSSDELQAAEFNTIGREDVVGTDENESIPGMFTDMRAGTQHHQLTMARIQGYPLSKNFLDQWMSYFLANTIMFSPAEEMDAPDHHDVSRVLTFLEASLNANTPIREVIKSWLGNLSRWRVSRSAENHALEMFELYLGVFNDTPEEQQNTINGGKACASWYLTSDNEDYQLRKNPYITEGAESYEVFGKLISSCAELYALVSGHPKVIPRVTEVIVNYFLDGSSSEAKQALIQGIVNTGPETFQDIFIPVIFSKEFLLNSERPKTFEENAFGFLNSMHWTPRSTTSTAFGSRMMPTLFSSSSTDAMALRNMGWEAMDYKIGRTPFVPMDALSFAFNHKGMRERVLLNETVFDGTSFPEVSDYTEAETSRQPPIEIKNGALYVAGTENLKPGLDGIGVDRFIDYVFLTALGRRASDVEREAFRGEGVTRDYLRVYDDVLEHRRFEEAGEFWEDRADSFAVVMLDYISRLPEFYYYPSVSN